MRGRATIATMEVYKQMKASRPVTLVRLENTQALIMSKTGNARRVALDMLNPPEDRITATAHVAQARSRQEAPLHAHLAMKDMLNPPEHRTTATAHVAQARSRREAPLHAHLAMLDMLNHYQHKEIATLHVQQASILHQERLNA